MNPQQSSALAEGRRVYVGNLLYSVTPTDMETILQSAGFDYENIHISVDPVSGRNPGYCFVEFKTQEMAAAALETLNGVKVYDRPLKVGPCTPKSNAPRDPTRRPAERPTFERWGDWRGSREQSATTPPAGASAPDRASQQGPYGAVQHLNDMKAAQFQDGTRLYVGGLPKMIDQDHNDREIRELFEGFDFIAIGKRITPHAATQEKPGNHHYCFVDFVSADEAQRAMLAVNGRVAPGGQGGRLRVSQARGRAPLKEDPLDADDMAPEDQQQQKRRSYQPSSYASNRPGRAHQDGAPSPAKDPREGREERDARTKEILAAGSWRRA